MSVAMANTKPFVAVACFCEQVLQEADGVLSAIRIVDTYTIQPSARSIQFTPEGPLPVIPVRGLISLRSGDVKDTGTVELIMHRTTGETVHLSPVEGWPAILQGNEHGFNVRLDFLLGVKNFGLMWFDVTWNGELLTRIPLMLKQAEPPKTPTAPS